MRRGRRNVTAVLGIDRRAPSRAPRP